MTSTHLGLSINCLNLKNFATFEDQTINFSQGFNAIIGETGSGKSLILDALQLIFGQRADKKLIRKGCDFSIVEASFKCEDSSINKYFTDIGFPFDDGEVVIKRVLYKTGKTKSYLNHQICSLANLVSFSKKYIDLVGQFENQKLLSEDYQLLLLDNFANNFDLLKEYKSVYESLLTNRKELETAKQSSSERMQKIDYISFQLSELETLNPSTSQEQALVEEKNHFQNFETNKQDIALLNTIFEGSDTSHGLLPLLSRAEAVLSESLLDTASINEFSQAKEILNDINFKINTSNEIEINESRLEQVLNELDLYQKLKRKFNVDTDGLIELKNKFTNELEQLSNIEDRLTKLEDSIKKLSEQAKTIAHRMHEKRVHFSHRLATSLTNEVRSLNMVGATIKIELELSENLGPNGSSLIKFCAETNPGEGYYKVKDIASGGELSRILLSLRKVLSAKDSISIFLFDEIDSGIGGETAISVGKTLAGVSDESQVIAITHLPQIANFANKLVVVSKDQIKSEKKSRTVSEVREVIGAGIKQEISTMTALH